MPSTRVDGKRLSGLLDEFHLLTSVRISFWDDSGRHMAANRGGNSAFCAKIREIPELDAACRECDRAGIACAREKGGLHVFTCHAGLHEYVYPVQMSGRLIGYFMIGQVNMPDVYGDIVSEKRDMLLENGLDEGEMRRLLSLLPVMTHEKMLAAAHMLEALAGYIYMNGLVRMQERPLCEKLQEYIDENLSRPLALDEIAAHLKVSRSLLCHTVRRERNESVVSMIQRRRSEKAALLIREGCSLSEAAQKAGFSTPAYMKRVMKKTMGITPAAIRNGDEEDESGNRESAPRF